MNAHLQELQARDGYAILGALRRRGANLTRVAEGLGVSLKLVHDTAHGRNNNRRVLRRMLDMGIPAEILHLPQDLRTETKEVAA